MTAVILPASRSKTIALWVLRVLMAVLFLFASFMKLSNNLMMIHEFDTIGLGQWFRYLTGLLELAGSVAVLTPAASVYGAIILLTVDVGALITQVAILHGDWIHTIVIGALLASLIYLQRHRLTDR